LKIFYIDESFLDQAYYDHIQEFI